MPVAMVTPSVNSRMRPSIARFNETGRSAGGAIPEINRLAQNAMIRPNPPPIADTSRLSVRSCRMSRNRLAPMDRRIAISLRPADVGASGQEHHRNDTHQNREKSGDNRAQARIHDVAGGDGDGPVSIRLRIGLFELSRECVEIGGCLGWRNPGLQSAEN